MKDRAKNKAKEPPVYEGGGMNPADLKRMRAFCESVEFIGEDVDELDPAGEPPDVDPDTETSEDELDEVIERMR